MSKTLNKRDFSGPVDLVVGDGWAALLVLALLRKCDRPVVWLEGASPYLMAPYPTVEKDRGGAIWSILSQVIGLSSSTVGRDGVFLREYKNKTFRPLNTAGDRWDELWEPEASWVPKREWSLGLSLAQVQVELGHHFRMDPGVVSVTPKSVKSLEWGEWDLKALVCGSPESGDHHRIDIQHLYFADRWSQWNSFAHQAAHGVNAGAPIVTLPRLKGKRSYGILQAVFQHRFLDEGAPECFSGWMIPLHREAGEEELRHVWVQWWKASENATASFKSVWTLFLDPEEGEDNHLIGKKLRRIKQAQAKIFEEENWKHWSPVREEQVKFEESALMAGGEPLRRGVQAKALKNATFLTDGYGPHASAEQAWESVLDQVGPGIRAEMEGELARMQAEWSEHPGRGSGLPLAELTPELGGKPETSAQL